ncbi:heme exporter protein CcmD [Thalassotalea psychrophila]|uniref:Heme exporter protein D n=1 Tax=Thalassotalea psychrophila TaxID=3065647 RepID=A0ABY9TWH1_9GAMM|nr:heme exporter protein CcmD [Colwelliaceae bacterium SQ149]
MAFNSFAEFLNMGGYAFYVWLSYGFTAVLLIILTINSVKMETQIIKQIKQRIKREAKLKQAAQRRKEEM